MIGFLEREAALRQQYDEDQQRKKEAADAKGFAISQAASEMAFRANQQREAKKGFQAAKQVDQQQFALRQQELDQRGQMERARILLQQQIAKESAAEGRARFGLSADVASDQARRAQQELDFRQSQPNQIDVLREQFTQSGAKDATLMATELMSQARQMNLSDEGKKALAGQAARLQAILASRGEMSPQQIQQVVGKWMQNFEQTNFSQYAQPEISAQQRFDGSIAKAPNGQTMVMDARGNWQPLDSQSGTTAAVQAATPQDYLMKIASNPDTVEQEFEEARQRLETQYMNDPKNQEATAPPQFTPEQLRDEIVRKYNERQSRMSLLTGQPPGMPPTGATQPSAMGMPGPQSPATPTPGFTIPQEAPINVKNSVLPGDPRNMPFVRTDEEYEALPPGSVFVDGDSGDVLRKPGESQPTDPVSATIKTVVNAGEGAARAVLPESVVQMLEKKLAAKPDPRDEPGRPSSPPMVPKEQVDKTLRQRFAEETKGESGSAMTPEQVQEVISQGYQRMDSMTLEEKEEFDRLLFEIERKQSTK
jgi:hypothetical protein